MISKVNIIVFIAALLVLGVFVFVLPSDPDASQYENRSMAGFPELSAGKILGGNLSDGLEAFLLDSIAVRTRFLAFSTMMEDAYGIRIGGAIKATIPQDDLGMGMISDPDMVYQDLPEPGTSGTAGNASGSTGDASGSAGDASGSTGDASGSTGDASGSAGDASGSTGDASGSTGDASGSASSGDTTASQDSGSAYTPTNNHVNPNAPFGVDVNYDPDAVMYGGFYIDSSSVTRYVEVMNEYRRDMPDNVRMYCLLVPTQVEFLHEKYSTDAARQDAVVRTIYEKLDSGIIAVGAYDRIAAHAENEYLYFRTDHHWTAVGAYYAYLAFTEAAGIAPVTIDNYIEHASPDYIGTFGAGTQNKTVLQHPDTIYFYQLDNGTTFTQRLFFIPEDMSKMSYMVFMGGDHALLDYTSTNRNGKTLVIIKDSYANAFIPWVSANYERIIVIDPRQFNGGVIEYLEGVIDVDLLFLTSAFTPSLPQYVEHVAGVKSIAS